MAHLRGHPLYVPLPHPCAVRVRSLADVARFRQDSWQWDALHAGRVTGSCAAACLGLLEPSAAREIGIPPQMAGSHKAAAAAARLRARGTLRTLEQMRQLEEGACEAAAAAAAGVCLLPTDGCDDVWAWALGVPGGCPFAAEHTPPRGMRPPPGAERRWARNVGQVRMAWGTAQEPVGLLAALNFFGTCERFEGARLEECGCMCGEALADNTAPGGGAAGAAAAGVEGGVAVGVAGGVVGGVAVGPPLVGASPDGLMRFPDGHTEIVEVKCHAPFAASRGGGGGGGGSGFNLHDRGPYSDVGPWHVPQLMLEVYCAGPSCTAANLLSLSATRGVIVHRVPRDDAWIECMLALFGRFHAEWCTDSPGGSSAPPPDFWHHDEQAAWLRRRTRKVAAEAEIVAKIENDLVQRGSIASWGPLFFDD